jgi:hypothetical protein
MSITANKVIAEGNSIYIRSLPQTGIIALTSFVDNSSASNGASFTKTFRYSLNGITFTDWQPLTINNITAIPVTQSDIIIIELQYQKNPVGTNDATVTNATIGTSNTTIDDQFYFTNSVFYQFFGSNDIEVLNWTINVLEKLFKEGLIPSYIDRYDDNNSPDDFLDFWRSVCKFFAYYVSYARAYQTFYNDINLIREYLEERGIKTSSEDNLPQLYYLMQHFYNEIFHRGTIHIIDKPDGGDIQVFGELLRLIYYKDATDEFIFNINKTELFGWNLNNGSPLYRGLTNHDNANKWYEKNAEPSDITKYPTTGTVTLVTDNTIGKKVLHINNGGIHGNFSTGKIKVSPMMDYELFFMMRKDDGNNLSVGFEAYDKDGNVINLQSRKDGTALNDFFVNVNFQRSDKYFGVSMILYNKSKPIFVGENLNLRMVDNIAYVVPKILINGATADVYYMRFCPLLTPYSKGFLQVNNFIDCWLKNNNHEFTFEDIRKYIVKYLIPYNSKIALINVDGGAGDYSQDIEDEIQNNIINALVTEGGDVILTEDSDYIVP